MTYLHTYWMLQVCGCTLGQRGRQSCLPSTSEPDPSASRGCSFPIPQICSRSPWVSFRSPWVSFRSPWVSFRSPWVTFRSLWMPSGSLWMPYGSWVPYRSPWMPSGSLWMPYGSSWVPYGSPWMPSGSLWMPSGSSWVPYGSPWMPSGSLWMPYGSPWATLCLSCRQGSSVLPVWGLMKVAVDMVSPWPCAVLDVEGDRCGGMLAWAVG